LDAKYDIIADISDGKQGKLIMKLRNAMVLWNDNTSITHQREIVVVDH
jgi:hypothetical protein